MIKCKNMIMSNDAWLIFVLLFVGCSRFNHNLTVCGQNRIWFQNGNLQMDNGSMDDGPSWTCVPCYGKIVHWWHCGTVRCWNFKIDEDGMCRHVSIHFTGLSFRNAGTSIIQYKEYKFHRWLHKSYLQWEMERREMNWLTRLLEWILHTLIMLCVLCVTRLLSCRHFYIDFGWNIHIQICRLKLKQIEDSLISFSRLNVHTYCGNFLQPLAIIQQSN